MEYNPYDEISASEAERLAKLNSGDYWPGQSDYEPDSWFHGESPWAEDEPETEFCIQ